MYHIEWSSGAKEKIMQLYRHLSQAESMTGQIDGITVDCRVLVEACRSGTFCFLPLLYEVEVFVIGFVAE